jgi:hypothetical protein
LAEQTRTPITTNHHPRPREDFRSFLVESKPVDGQGVGNGARAEVFGRHLGGFTVPWALFDRLEASKYTGLRETKPAAFTDTAPFLSESFDPQEYANNIIEAPTATNSKGQSSKSSDVWLTQTSRKDLDVEGDVSVALSRLNLAIDDVDRLIRDEVTAHANDLLTHTTTLLALRPSLTIMTDSLRALQDHQAKLIQRVSVPRASLTAHTTRLSRMRSAQSLVKRSERFVKLVRRLQGQMKSLSAAEKKTDDRNRLESLEEVEGEGDGTDVLAEDDILDAEIGEERSRGLSMAALTLSEICECSDSGIETRVLKTLFSLVVLVEPHRKRQARNTDATELDNGLEDQTEASLTGLDFVKEMLPFVNEARERVTNLMEDMVVRGLRDLSPTLLSTSLQTAFNLGQLADLVRDLLADLNDVIRDRVAAAFDMQALSRELGTREPNLHQTGSYSSYRSKRGQAQMDTSMSTPQSQKWNAALWSKLETLIVGEMGAVCSKVYTLERVLSLKTDQMTGTNYLEEAMSVLGDRPSAIFWATLSKAVDTQSRHWTKSSSFLSQTFATSYPRLVRLFHDFFDKVAIYAETVSYTLSVQSPETLQMLAALGHLQDAYIARSRAKLDSFLASSFSPQRAAGSQEGQTAARLVGEEIDRARFDPLLLASVIQMVQSWLTTLIKAVQDQRSRDTTAYSMQRSATSPAQINNANLASAVFALISGLKRLLDQGPEEWKASIKSAIDAAEHLYRKDLVEPLLYAVNKELSDTFARMHYVDFGLDQDAVLGGSGGSAYMSDLSDRMWYIREQLLVHYNVESDKSLW